MTSIRLAHTLDVPIYKQIVTQLRVMIESGQLVDGDRLPSIRTLAENLHINRHTVAKAYGELRDVGLLDTARNGAVVRAAEGTRQKAAVNDRAGAILTDAIRRCMQLGLAAEEVSALATRLVTNVETSRLRVTFVECSAERAELFARELTDRLQVTVTPLVIGHFDAESVDADLVLTTYFHLADVRRSMRQRARDVVAVVIAPHVETLIQLAGVPKDRRVGILSTTNEQAQSMRDILTQSGVTQIHVLADSSDPGAAEVDVMVIPSELLVIADRLPDGLPVIEYRSALDEASIRSVSAVLDELAEAQASTLVHRPPSTDHQRSDAQTDDLMSGTPQAPAGWPPPSPQVPPGAANGRRQV